MQIKSSTKSLNYVIYKPRSLVTLDLYEAEKYEPAIIVQSLVGNLVYYSNKGRYEPRLARSWERTDLKTWVFELNENLTCENGEKITPKSFKRSLERVIAYLSKSEDVPILNNLVGYEDFKKNSRELSGISTKENKIIFSFKQPQRSGVIQILSFAPFGYIAAENFNSDGSWKNKEKFISSGPYKIKKIILGEIYQLEKRNSWTLDFSINSPDEITFTHTLPEKIDNNESWIIDTFTSTIDVPKNLTKYPLVPEYINPIVLGNLKNGFFSKIKNRQIFKSTLRKNQQLLPKTWGAHTLSQTFYPSQYTPIEPGNSENYVKDFVPSTKPLIIEGKIPDLDTPRDYAWKVLHSTLNELNIPYRFNNNEADMKFVTDPSFDIKLRGSSIGGGVEPWGIRVIFCSDLGPKFPDPSGKICSALDDYDLEKVNEEDFSKIFFSSIEEDAAIIPISHYGIQLYLSNNIDVESISPSLEIVRFDKIEIK